MVRAILILLFSIVIFSNFANAEVVELWICQESPYGNWEDILVTATINKGRNDGTIEVAGVKYKSHFTTQGFNRRFDFGQNNNVEYVYSFIIKPNGEAFYLDFSNASKGESVSASMVFHCKQK